MKKISVLIPCYNEEDNVIPMSQALIQMFGKDLPKYDYEILFIDNAKNFGQFNSPYMGCYRRPAIVLCLCAVIFRIR